MLVVTETYNTRNPIAEEEYNDSEQQTYNTYTYKISGSEPEPELELELESGLESEIETFDLTNDVKDTFNYKSRSKNNLLPYYTLSVVVSLSLLNIVSVSITRKLLRIIEKSNRHLSIILLFLIDIFVISVLYLSPLLILSLLWFFSVNTEALPALIFSIERSSLYTGITLLAVLQMLMSITNLALFIPSLGYIILVLILLINYVVWPLILRPLYSIIDQRIFYKKRTLLAIGGVLVSNAFYPGQIALFYKTFTSLY